MQIYLHNDVLFIVYRRQSNAINKRETIMQKYCSAIQNYAKHLRRHLHNTIYVNWILFTHKQRIFRNI